MEAQGEQPGSCASLAHGSLEAASSADWSSFPRVFLHEVGFLAWRAHIRNQFAARHATWMLFETLEGDEELQKKGKAAMMCGITPYLDYALSQEDLKVVDIWEDIQTWPEHSPHVGLERAVSTGHSAGGMAAAAATATANQSRSWQLFDPAQPARRGSDVVSKSS